ncbi:MAG: polysaccharide deacetylase family protein, partial [Peptococcaceae bacterium]|nr:polysaccharide deacetylase family protein [Peptococcaceae bacterium]
HDYRQRTLATEIAKTDQVVFAATHAHTHFYRPPGGIVAKAQLEIVKTNGHIFTLWSLDSRDWVNPGPTQILRTVVDNVFPGSIILLHDGGDRRGQTIAALPTIITRLRSMGYSFVSLEELRHMDNSSIPTGWE